MLIKEKSWIKHLRFFFFFFFSLSYFQKKKLNFENKNKIIKEIEEAQKEVDETKKKFDEIDQVLKDDLDRFDYTFKQDFQDSMKSYVQNMVQSQNEISQWWDSYIKDTESGKNNNI